MSRHYKPPVWPLLAVALTGLALSACGPLGQRLSRNETVEVDGQSVTVLYQDDFSSDSTGWDTFVELESATRYSGDAYQIEVLVPEQIVWGNANLRRPLEHARISVDVRNESTAADAGFGVLCYYREDARSFYYFEVGADSYYVIMKVVDNQQTSILAGDNFSDDIPQYAGSYSLAVSCTPGRQVLFVNGVEIDGARDSDLAAGDIGLMASSFQETGVNVFFDNVLVTAE